MPLTETRRPYEFLARWNPQTGAFSGAHIQWIDVIERDGTQVSATPTKAFGVGEGAAFPLADILTQVQAGALAALDAAQAQVATLTADKTAADQALAAAQQQVAELTAQLAQYQTPVDENGVPTRVPRRKAKTLMELTPAAGFQNLWEASLAAANAIQDPAQRIITRNYLTDSLYFETATVKSLAVSLMGLTAQQVDQMMVAADQLPG